MRGISILDIFPRSFNTHRLDLLQVFILVSKFPRSEAAFFFLWNSCSFIPMGTKVRQRNNWTPSSSPPPHSPPSLHLLHPSLPLLLISSIFLEDNKMRFNLFWEWDFSRIFKDKINQFSKEVAHLWAALAFFAVTSVLTSRFKGFDRLPLKSPLCPALHILEGTLPILPPLLYHHIYTLRCLKDSIAPLSYPLKFYAEALHNICFFKGYYSNLWRNLYPSIKPLSRNVSMALFMYSDEFLVSTYRGVARVPNIFAFRAVPLVPTATFPSPRLWEVLPGYLYSKYWYSELVPAWCPPSLIFPLATYSEVLPGYQFISIISSIFRMMPGYLILCLCSFILKCVVLVPTVNSIIFNSEELSVYYHHMIYYIYLYSEVLPRSLPPPLQPPARPPLHRDTWHPSAQVKLAKVQDSSEEQNALNEQNCNNNGRTGQSYLPARPNRLMLHVRGTFLWRKVEIIELFTCQLVCLIGLTVIISWKGKK